MTASLWKGRVWRHSSRTVHDTYFFFFLCVSWHLRISRVTHWANKQQFHGDWRPWTDNDDDVVFQGERSAAGRLQPKKIRFEWKLCKRKVCKVRIIEAWNLAIGIMGCKCRFFNKLLHSSSLILHILLDFIATFYSFCHKTFSTSNLDHTFRTGVPNLFQQAGRRASLLGPCGLHTPCLVEFCWKPNS